MENIKITAQSLLKIGYEPYRNDGKICYKKDSNLYWFENGVIMGDGLTAWVLEKLNEKIAKS